MDFMRAMPDWLKGGIFTGIFTAVAFLIVGVLNTPLSDIVEHMGEFFLPFLMYVAASFVIGAVVFAAIHHTSTPRQDNPSTAPSENLSATIVRAASFIIIAFI